MFGAELLTNVTAGYTNSAEFRQSYTAIYLKPGDDVIKIFSLRLCLS